MNIMRMDDEIDAYRADQARRAAEQADPAIAVDPSWSTPAAALTPIAAPPTEQADGN